MNAQALMETARALVAGDKGLLAMDESNPTCNKRFAKLGIPQTPEARRAYREMIVTTPGLAESISGAILFDETIRQQKKDGTPLLKAVADAGIIPGIKVDAGAKDMAGHPGEKITAAMERILSMKTSIPPLTTLASWKALEAHYQKVRELHLRQLFADDPKRGERMTVEAVGIYFDYSKHRITDETLRLLLAIGGGIRPAGPHRRHVPRRQDQRHGEAGRPARRPARAQGAIHRRGRRRRRAAGPRRARQDGRLLQPRAQRGMEGPHRQADPQRRQHRHRRLRPGAGDGVRGAAGITASAT